MHDPDPKCRHFGILAFLPKSRIGNQIQFFQIYLIFSDFQTFPDFPTFRFHSSSIDNFEEANKDVVDDIIVDYVDDDDDIDDDNSADDNCDDNYDGSGGDDDTQQGEEQ